jgi:hypothetical protein
MKQLKFFLLVSIGLVILSSCRTCICRKGKNIPYSMHGEKITLEPITSSKLINYVSYYWKIDTLANNGYRKEVKKHFLNCILDSVSYEYVLEKLGKSEWGENDTLRLSYYYYNTLNMSEKYKSNPIKDKIFFIFNPITKRLSNIDFSK